MLLYLITPGSAVISLFGKSQERIQRRGFRQERIMVVTTLLDAQRYTVQKLTQLYGRRWSAAEVSLRHLKTTKENGDVNS